VIDLQALAAGFAADLCTALEDCGFGVDLRDILPFVELVGEGGAARVHAAVAIATADASSPAFTTDRVVGDHRVAMLHRAAVAALARFDDLALPALYRAVAQRRFEPAVSPRLAGEIRGLVILCRCAIANGWEVLAIAPCGRPAG
jgi:hypothetical protein